MTRPSNFATHFARTDGDFDLASLLNNRDFQAALSQYPNSNPFPVLAQYLLDNYNIRVDESVFDDSDSEDSIELNPIQQDEEDAYADRLLQAIVNGQREVPMRRILPVTPPPSPMPNPALNPGRVNHQFSQIPPPLPPRRRSQLSTSVTNNSWLPGHRFVDPNASEEVKSPLGGYEVLSSPLDKNNELPFTAGYQQRLRERRQQNFDLPGR